MLLICGHELLRFNFRQFAFKSIVDLYVDLNPFLCDMVDKDFNHLRLLHPSKLGDFRILFDDVLNTLRQYFFNILNASFCQ